jgi:hypothetical protein
VGTARFREDVSVALSKFMRSHPDKTPQTLKARYRDVMDWHTAERSSLPLSQFVTTVVQAYVGTIPWQRSTLRCPAELLDVDDESPTRFE